MADEKRINTISKITKYRIALVGHLNIDDMEKAINAHHFPIGTFQILEWQFGQEGSTPATFVIVEVEENG